MVDRLFARHEKALIERTVVGLLDEGIGVRLLVPRSGFKHRTSWETPVERTPYVDRGVSIMLPIRARSLAQTLREQAPDTSWDIVHAFGGQTWPLALELARRFDAALVLELWRLGLVSRAQSIVRSDSVEVMCLVPDQSFIDAIEREGVDIPVRVATWGVPSPISPREVLSDDGGVSIVFHSGGRDRVACVTAFDGVADAVREHPETHLFVNIEASQRAGLWERARGAGILDRVTMVDQIEHQRDLALSADIYIDPDTVHEHRSMLLEALANGLVVVSADEEQSSAVRDGETAVIVRDLTPAAWTGAVAGILGDREHARRIGQQAWSYVREHRKLSTHIGSTIDAYAQVTGQTVGA